MTTPKQSSRLEPIDALRGLAALAVPAFTHFQHFGGDRGAYPYNSLSLVHGLYVYSQFFVDLFFVLSGFVLTFRYYEPISEGRTGAREFFFLRFARLYPLHLLTLLMCATIEWSLMADHVAPMIYKQDDLYHFFLHLTFLQIWFEKGLAYNYPSWSVCVEVFVYVLFFFHARRKPQGFIVACALTVLLGITVLTNWSLPLLNRNIARGLVGFFVGALSLRLMQWFDRTGRGRLLGLGSLAALVVIGVVAHAVTYDFWIGSDPLPYGLVLFPLVTLAALRVKPIAAVLSLRPFLFLGDISYAVYLIHVPIQMIILSVAHFRQFTIPTSSPWFFWTWLATLLVAGTMIHFAFERPARRWLRGRLVDSTRPAV
jgi:peptidoglycan/LPS O-acetylase OafA/YrhL